MWMRQRLVRQSSRVSVLLKDAAGRGEGVNGIARAQVRGSARASESTEGIGWIDQMDADDTDASKIQKDRHSVTAQEFLIRKRAGQQVTVFRNK